MLRTGRRTVKGVAGYDLTKLFVGSEGTLGIITEATLALRPTPQRPFTLVAAFATTDAGRAGRRAGGHRRAWCRLMEIMDAPASGPSTHRLKPISTASARARS